MMLMKMDAFEQKKKSALTKDDRSNKGYVDKGIAGLCRKINCDDGCFTTSSCSGRISVVLRPSGKKKTDTAMLFCSHEKVNSAKRITEQIENADLTAYGDHSVWLRVEPMILHIMCRNIEKAFWLSEKALKAGLKKTGIRPCKSTAKTGMVVLEISGQDMIEHLLCDNALEKLDFKLLTRLIFYADNKMDANLKKIRLLESSLSQ